jgi:MYXO-CTERM domain-containing protein
VITCRHGKIGTDDVQVPAAPSGGSAARAAPSGGFSSTGAPAASDRGSDADGCTVRSGSNAGATPIWSALLFAFVLRRRWRRLLDHRASR